MNLYLLLILTFAFLSKLTGSELSDPVLDWKGGALEVGYPYDVWVVGEGRGPIGFGQTTPTQNLYVIDKPYNPENPFFANPVIFYPTNPSEPLVRVASDYNIAFDLEKRPQLHVWQINLDVGSKDHNFVTTGGYYRDPGCWSVNSWFQFVPVNVTTNLYKIISNPQVCNNGEVRNCPMDITLESKDGEDRLYLNQDNFLNSPGILVRFVSRRDSEIRQVVGMNSWL